MPKFLDEINTPAAIRGNGIYDGDYRCWSDGRAPSFSSSKSNVVASVSEIKRSYGVPSINSVSIPSGNSTQTFATGNALVDFTTMFVVGKMYAGDGYVFTPLSISARSMSVFVASSKAVTVSGNVSFTGVELSISTASVVSSVSFTKP